MTDISAVQALASSALPSCTYNNGTVGVGATLTASSNGALTIDGYAVLLGDRIAVTQQSGANQPQNGIYSLTTLGDGSDQWVLTRTTDFNTPAAINAQLPFCVLNGTEYTGSIWCSSAVITTIGTDGIQFQQMIQGFARSTATEVFALGNVGIGTTSPAFPLEVHGTLRLAGTLATGSIAPPSDTTTAIQILNAAQSTVVVDIDTTNDRVGIGTSSPIVSLDLSQNTDALALPVGTTAQRPTGANGELRYNSTNNAVEGYVNGAWATLSTGSGGGRTLLTATTNYYVATTGSDSNPGTSGSPWLTIQHAINYIQQNIDLGGQTVNINVANGTYTGAISVSAPFTGGGTVQLIGNTTTPSSCIISVTSVCISVSGGGSISASGFETQTAAAGVHITGIDPGSSVYINGNWNFGGSNKPYCHIYFQLGSMCNISANYTISVGATGNHWYSLYNAMIYANSLTITLSGTPSFGAFAQAYNATLGIAANTYSGAATGARYSAVYNGYINSGGTTLPGNSAGSTGNGGQYS